MKWLLNFGWCIIMPFVKWYYRIYKKSEFESGSYISYLTKLEGHNHIGKNSYVLGTQMGYGTNISCDAYFYNAKVGKYTCIGPRVAIVCGQHPISKFVSIHPAFYSVQGSGGLKYVFEQLFEEYRYADENKKYSVIIGNDVWIGADAKIMEGVTIGDGAVVATGALVLKDVKPYEIVVGAPAKVVKYRFDEEGRNWLLKFRWWDKSEQWIKDNAEYFKDIEVLKKSVTDK